MLRRARMCSTTRHQSGRGMERMMAKRFGVSFSAWRTVIIAPVMFAISACGGGSTGSSVTSTPTPNPTPAPTPTPTVFTNWQSIPATGVLRLTGSTVEAPYTPPAPGALSSAGTFGTVAAGNLTADITYTSGAQTGVYVQGALTSINFTSSDGSIKVRLASSPNIVKYAASQSASTSLLMLDASAAGYSYMSYGAWAGNLNGTGYTNSFQGGSVTPSGSVPLTGSAIYTGNSVGYYSTQFGTVTEATSDVTLAANFGSRTLTYRSSNSQGGPNIFGTLSYSAGSSAFSGTLDARDPINNIGLFGLSGTANGNFYGPQGQEIAGTFVLHGTVGSITEYVGSFGAKRP